MVKGNKEMCEVEEMVKLLPLKEDEKTFLGRKLKNGRINTLNFLQGNIYITLDTGKMIILKNGNIQSYSLIRQIEEKCNEKFLLNEANKNNKTIKKIIWTNDEIEFLKQNAHNYSLEELTKILKKIMYQIEERKIQLKLYSIKPWEDYEEKFLEENKDKSLYFLAEKLNRSIAAVKARKRKKEIDEKKTVRKT